MIARAHTSKIDQNHDTGTFGIGILNMQYHHHPPPPAAATTIATTTQQQQQQQQQQEQEQKQEQEPPTTARTARTARTKTTRTTRRTRRTGRTRRTRRTRRTGRTRRTRTRTLTRTAITMPTTTTTRRRTITITRTKTATTTAMATTTTMMTTTTRTTTATTTAAATVTTTLRLDVSARCLYFYFPYLSWVFDFLGDFILISIAPFFQCQSNIQEVHRWVTKLSNSDAPIHRQGIQNGFETSVSKRAWESQECSIKSVLEMQAKKTLLAPRSGARASTPSEGTTKRQGKGNLTPKLICKQMDW